jgi:hypothetical protein
MKVQLSDISEDLVFIAVTFVDMYSGATQFGS